MQTYNHIIAQCIENLAVDYSQALGSGLEYQAIIDFKNNHYQLVRLGWVNRQFFYQILIHIDIKKDKEIWIQQNNTEISLSEILVNQGVIKSDIILGFRPSYLRESAIYAQP
jgi:hypothetical protein